jgi:hypothetical protein
MGVGMVKGTAKILTEEQGNELRASWPTARRKASAAAGSFAAPLMKQPWFVILNEVKDPSECRWPAMRCWILRCAQDDGLF